MGEEMIQGIISERLQADSSFSSTSLENKYYYEKTTD